MEKICSKCKIIKKIVEFPTDPKRKTCKQCRLTEWVPRENEILKCNNCGEDKVYTEFSRRGKQKPFQCKRCINEKSRNNRTEEKAMKIRQRYSLHKDDINATRRKYLQNRRDNDPQYRAMMALHCRLYIAAKQKTGKTMELTGCTRDELICHLASKFTESMTWQNYGEWHIDHIRPCSSFDLTDAEQQRECFHWSNLQPLWAADNLKKGCKFTDS